MSFLHFYRHPSIDPHYIELYSLLAYICLSEANSSCLDSRGLILTISLHPHHVMLSLTQNRCSIRELQMSCWGSEGAMLDCWWKDFLPETMNQEAGGWSHYILWQRERTGEGLVHLYYVRDGSGSEKRGYICPCGAPFLKVWVLRSQGQLKQKLSS